MIQYANYVYGARSSNNLIKIQKFFCDIFNLEKNQPDNMILSKITNFLKPQIKL